MIDSHTLRVAYTWVDPDNPTGTFAMLECETCEHSERVNVRDRDELDTAVERRQRAHREAPDAPPVSARRRPKSAERIHLEKRIGQAALALPLLIVAAGLLVSALTNENEATPEGDPSRKYSEMECEVLRWEALGDGPNADKALIQWDVHCG